MSAPMSMPYRLLAVLAIGLLCLPLAQCGGEDDELLSVTPKMYDFGRIRHGEKRIQKFTLRNNSDRAITIAKAQPNCGCFKTGPISRSRLDPGKETVITVYFESGAVPAQRLKGKFLHVLTDHEEVPGLRIPLEGHIFAPVELKIADGLDKLYFGLIGSEGSRTPRRCFFHVEPRYTAQIATSVQRFEKGYAIYPANLAPLFDVSIEKTKGGYEVSVQLKEGAKNPGGSSHELKGTITFHVKESGPGLGERVVPYTVQMHGTWPSR